MGDDKDKVKDEDLEISEEEAEQVAGGRTRLAKAQPVEATLPGADLKL
jgi:hypothetical protein